MNSTWTLGFLGTGKISSAVCRGYCSASAESRPSKILVSSRSLEKSQLLALDYPDIVEVVESNAELVSRSDIVFIGLIPSVAREVLPVMPWSGRTLIVSMMAAVKYEEVLDLVRQPSELVVRIVPLPSSARRCGPILQYPINPVASQLFAIVGTPVCCQEETEMIPLVSITGHISPFYLLMNACQTFLQTSGVSETAARDFTSSFYASLSDGAMQSSHSFEELADEAATPGGLNEQAMKFLSSTDHYALFNQSLVAIKDRLSK